MAVYPSKRKSATGERVWRIVRWHEGESHETTHTGTKRDADKKDRALAAKLEAAPKAKPRAAAVSLSGFVVDTYQDHAKAHLGAGTWKVRRYQLDTICRHLGALKLTELVTERIEEFKAARRAADDMPATINTLLTKLSAVLSYARSLGIPCASPTMRHLPVRGTGRVKFWTPEQIGKLFAAVEREAPEILGLVVCLANTGMRRTEALVCERSWVNLDRGLLEIQPNEYWQPKNGLPREVPISDALLPWLTRAKAAPSRYVFPSRNGDRYACFPKLQFARALRAAGLADDGEGAHKLRHSFAAGVLAGGGDLYLLQQLLGHANVKTTQIYAHLLPGHLEKARNLVNLGPAVGPAKLEARKRWG